MTTRTRPSRPAAASRRKRPLKAATTTRPNSPAPPPADREQVVLAVVTGAHGIGGEVKLKLFTDDLGGYAAFNGGALTLAALRGPIARFAEVTDRTAAEALRGTALTVARSALPPLAEGEYYHADLIGLPVLTPEGASIGHVVAVENFGACDVIEVERPMGGRFMAPLRPEAVPEWNGERLVIEPAWVEP